MPGTVYDELIEFIARGHTTEQVSQFKVSDATQSRASELLSKETRGEITPEERAELDYFVQLEHILRMAKGHARLLRQLRR